MGNRDLGLLGPGRNGPVSRLGPVPLVLVTTHTMSTLPSPKDDFIKTTYDISLDSQISLLPRGFSLLVGSEKTSGNKG